MNLKAAATIYKGISRSRLEDPKRALIDAALRYAGQRVEYALADQDGRMKLEDSRTRAHNVLIDACNILNRAMSKSGEDNSWREKLGDDRREIGDFACCLHAVLGLKAR